MGKRSRALSVALTERPLAGRKEKPALLEVGGLAEGKVGLSSHPMRVPQVQADPEGFFFSPTAAVR